MASQDVHALYFPTNLRNLLQRKSMLEYQMPKKEEPKEKQSFSIGTDEYSKRVN